MKCPTTPTPITIKAKIRNVNPVIECVLLNSSIQLKYYSTTMNELMVSTAMIEPLITCA